MAWRNRWATNWNFTGRTIRGPWKNITRSRRGVSSTEEPAHLSSDVTQRDHFSHVWGKDGGCYFGFGAFDLHLRAGRGRLRTFELEPLQFLVDLAEGADALDNLLPQVAALVETDGVHLLGFLGQRSVADVFAVARLAVFDAHQSRVRGAGRHGSRAFQLAYQLRLGVRRAVDAITGLACDCERRRGVFTGWDLNRWRRRTFHADGSGAFGDVFELHLVGDDIAADKLVDLFAQLRLGVDQEMIGQAQQ